MKISGNEIFESFAVLTDYPRSAEEMRTCIVKLERAGLLENCLEMFSADTDGLREDYTRLFDFSKDTAPYAAFHIFSDERQRASFMCELSGRYRSEKFVHKTGELPDYIPSVLSFISVKGLNGCADLLKAVSEASGHIAASPLLEGEGYGLVYGSLKKFTETCIQGGANELEYGF